MDTTRSWDEFKLSKALKKSLVDNGLESPLPIQAATLQAALTEGKNVLGAARTGSGKTLAYAVPIINRILRNKSKPCSMLKRKLSKLHHKEQDFKMLEDTIIEEFSEGEDDQDSESTDDEDTTNMDKHSCPEAIILVPTRELATQVKEEFEKVGSRLGVVTYCLIGGLSQEKQVRKIKQLRPQVIVATPGRLYEVMQSDSVAHIDIHSVASIRTLVIDEADRMFEKGHFQEVLKIVDILNGSKEHRDEGFSSSIYLFSATLTFLHDLPDRLKTSSEVKRVSKVKQILKLLGIENSDNFILDLNDKSSGRPSSDQLKEYKINCAKSEKDLYLYYFLIEHPNKRVLVFCNSKDCLRRLCNVLKFLGKNPLKLFANMDQKKRLASLERFRRNRDSIMIATEVAARGLDIKDLDCVVHYQVPRTCESYIHRSGRTARLSKEGTCLTLCEPQEAASLRKLCANINSGKEFESYPINLRLRSSLKQRINLAQQCDKLDHQLKSGKSNRNWFLKAADEADIELDDDEKRRLDSFNQDDTKLKRRLQGLEKQLKGLLSKPIR